MGAFLQRQVGLDRRSENMQKSTGGAFCEEGKSHAPLLVRSVAGAGVEKHDALIHSGGGAGVARRLAKERRGHQLGHKVDRRRLQLEDDHVICALLHDACEASIAGEAGKEATDSRNCRQRRRHSKCAVHTKPLFPSSNRPAGM